MRRRSWSRLLSALPLLLALALPVSSIGCCSEELQTVLPAPVLPAGKPDGSIDRMLAKRQPDYWAYDHPIEGMVVMPINDLTLLLTIKEGWQAWALALVAAGRWRK